MTSQTAARLLENHRASGHAFTASGITSFALDEGPCDGEAVVCVHGVPASAFLYRKVVPALAARALRGIAVDLPGLGLGLAERPAGIDYSWTGLGRWLRSAIDALALEFVGQLATYVVRALQPGADAGQRPDQTRIENAVTAGSPGRAHR